MKKLLLAIAIFTSMIARGQGFDYYGPAPFGDILSQDFTKNWTPAAISNIENRQYVILIDQANAAQAVNLDGIETTGVSMTALDNVNGAAATYSSMMRSIFQLVDIATHSENDPNGQSGDYTPLEGNYKLVSALHSFSALSASTEYILVNGDAGSFHIADKEEQGYVLINFVGTASSAMIKGVNQFVYNSETATFDEVSSWSTKWVKIDGTSLVWTSTEADASSFMLANASDLLKVFIDDGSGFNPESVEYQLNATIDIPDEAFDMENNRILTDLERDLNDVSIAQLGQSADATTAAEAMLDEIVTTLAEKDATLRYPKEFYLALRTSMLEQKITSTDIYGAQVGYNTIPDVYFTNAADDSGVPHPFLVMTSHAISTRPNNLLDVSRPPGGAFVDGGTGYAASVVTRNGKVGGFLLKFPLKDYGLISTLLDNDLALFNGDLATDYDQDRGTTTTKDVYNYADPASIGVAIDGVTIYPAYNNNLRFTVLDAEITSSGIHVGGGLELHYHADGHAYTGNGINIYNILDFEGKDHPPVIGMGHDGIALFGRYEDSYSSMVGFGIGLDEYGGHDHGDDFGYHYHAFTQSFTSEKNIDFDEHFMMVGAWRGSVNTVPGFAQGKMDQLKDEEIARYVGGEYTPGSMSPLAVNDLLSKVSIHPNPSTGLFYIDADAQYDLNIYNLEGKLMKNIEANGYTDSFSVQELPMGIYIIHGTNGQDEFRSKIVIQ